jgi:hypothetical protein
LATIGGVVYKNRVLETSRKLSQEKFSLYTFLKNQSLYGHKLISGRSLGSFPINNGLFLVSGNHGGVSEMKVAIQMQRNRMTFGGFFLFLVENVIFNTFTLLSVVFSLKMNKIPVVNWQAYQLHWPVNQPVWWSFRQTIYVSVHLML